MNSSITHKLIRLFNVHEVSHIATANFQHLVRGVVVCYAIHVR